MRIQNGECRESYGTDTIYVSIVIISILVVICEFIDSIICGNSPLIAVVTIIILGNI
jgi:hypothetical protein